MAADGQAYRFNGGTFAFESFGDEIVVLNLIDGIYYAFGGAAVPAWPLIIAHHSRAAIASALAASYDVEPDVVAGDLAEFLGRLCEENILHAAPEATSRDGCTLSVAGEYQGFSFERHDDMEDLLTLDPIHDVDPQEGWPKIRRQLPGS